MASSCDPSTSLGAGRRARQRRDSTGWTECDQPAGRRKTFDLLLHLWPNL